MKRSILHAANQAGVPHCARQWHGTLSATVCTWREQPNISNVSTALLAASGVFLLTLVVLAPVYLLGLGLAGLAALSKGQNPLLSSVLSDPVLWLPVVGSSAVTGLLTLLLLARSYVVAFRFDSATAQFEYIENRCFLGPTTRRVPFESIVEVVPTVLSTFATSGHFNVNTRAPGGHETSLWLGNDIPLASLEAHGAWLATHLGKRVRPVLRLDC